MIDKLSKELRMHKMTGSINPVSHPPVTKENIDAQNTLKGKLKSRLQSRKNGTFDEVPIRETVQKNSRS